MLSSIPPPKSNGSPASTVSPATPTTPLMSPKTTSKSTSYTTPTNLPQSYSPYSEMSSPKRNSFSPMAVTSGFTANGSHITPSSTPINDTRPTTSPPVLTNNTYGQLQSMHTQTTNTQLNPNFLQQSQRHNPIPLPPSPPPPPNNIDLHNHQPPPNKNTSPCPLPPTKCTIRRNTPPFLNTL
eukprot:gene28630-32334_t